MFTTSFKLLRENYQNSEVLCHIIKFGFCAKIVPSGMAVMNFFVCLLRSKVHLAKTTFWLKTSVIRSSGVIVGGVKKNGKR